MSKDPYQDYEVQRSATIVTKTTPMTEVLRGARGARKS